MCGDSGVPKTKTMFCYFFVVVKNMLQRVLKSNSSDNVDIVRLNIFIEFKLKTSQLCVSHDFYYFVFLKKKCTSMFCF